MGQESNWTKLIKKQLHWGGGGEGIEVISFGNEPSLNNLVQKQLYISTIISTAGVHGGTGSQF